MTKLPFTKVIDILKNIDCGCDCGQAEIDHAIQLIVGASGHSRCMNCSGSGVQMVTDDWLTKCEVIFVDCKECGGTGYV